MPTAFRFPPARVFVVRLSEKTLPVAATIALRLCLTAAAIGLPSRAALAWGAAGHRVVALIAERHLTATAAATVNRLLATDGATSMAEVASWADEWRATHRQTGAWHYVDIPADAPGYDVERDCPRNQCVVAKIGRYWRILRDGSRSDADREEALKFLVHFVGDVHQPLHAADRHDRGGNEVRVIYAGRDVNLHHLWDTELVEAAEAQAGGQAALVETLDQGSPDTPPRAAPDPVAWANAAHAEAVAVAYGALPADPTADLSGAYAAQAVPVVDAQLRAAGLRLAAALNEALDPAAR